jgi:hypothetical protein
MPRDNNSNDFITVDDAARLVGRSHWTIRRWLEPGGKLTRYKSLNRTVVSRSELTELVKPKMDSGIGRGGNNDAQD